MILYFSATGNCKYVAARIAEKTNDVTFSVTECIKVDNYLFELEEDERVGIITPTYAFGLPVIVKDFMKRAKFVGKKNVYFYYVATYGTSCGQTGGMMQELLQKRGYSLDAKYSVKMPDSWTPTYDLSNPDKVRRINEKAEAIIDDVIIRVVAKTTGDQMKDKLPKFAVDIFYERAYEKDRQTKNFYVEDSCIGCGLCANRCPVNAIEICENKPEWTKDKCVMCLGCLHRCPRFAIQYGKNTKKHGQYINPNVRV